MKKLIITLSFVTTFLLSNAQDIYDISRDYLSSTYILDIQGSLKAGKFIKITKSLFKTNFSDTTKYEMVIATIDGDNVKIQKRRFTGPPPEVVVTNENKRKKIKIIVLIGRIT